MPSGNTIGSSTDAILDQLDGCIRKVNELKADNARMRRVLQNMQGYVAAEGHPDGDKLLVGLVNGSVWGPLHDPKYEAYEFAETIEKWLKDKCAEALGEPHV